MTHSQAIYLMIAMVLSMVAAGGCIGIQASSWPHTEGHAATLMVFAR